MSVSLVTGGAGLIGSHLVDALLARGDVVRVLDNFSTGTPDNLAEAANKIELFVGDLTDFDLVRRAAQGIEVVFHLAMPVQPGPGTVEAAADLGVRHVLTASREAGVRRVIYGSSHLVYGVAPLLPVEETAPTRPEGAYAQAKLAEEKACLALTRSCGLETVRLRYCNVFGPRQPHAGPYSLVVSRALEALQANKPPVFEDDGLTSQDLISVDDVVHANLLAAAAPRVSGRAYNVAGFRPVTASIVVSALNALTGAELRPVFGPPRRRGPLDTLITTLRAETELGFCAATDLERGLRRCLELSAAHAEHSLPSPHASGLSAVRSRP